MILFQLILSQVPVDFERAWLRGGADDPAISRWLIWAIGVLGLAGCGWLFLRLLRSRRRSDRRWAWVALVVFGLIELPFARFQLLDAGGQTRWAQGRSGTREHHSSRSGPGTSAHWTTCEVVAEAEEKALWEGTFDGSVCDRLDAGRPVRVPFQVWTVWSGIRQPGLFPSVSPLRLIFLGLIAFSLALIFAIHRTSTDEGWLAPLGPRPWLAWPFRRGKMPRPETPGSVALTRVPTTQPELDGFAHRWSEAVAHARDACLGNGWSAGHVECAFRAGLPPEDAPGARLRALGRNEPSAEVSRAQALEILTTQLRFEEAYELKLLDPVSAQRWAEGFLSLFGADARFHSVPIDTRGPGGVYVESAALHGVLYFWSSNPGR